jgi:hypothetical protein
MHMRPRGPWTYCIQIFSHSLNRRSWSEQERVLLLHLEEVWVIMKITEGVWCLMHLWDRSIFVTIVTQKPKVFIGGWRGVKLFSLENEEVSLCLLHMSLSAIKLTVAGSLMAMAPKSIFIYPQMISRFERGEFASSKWAKVFESRSIFTLPPPSPWKAFAGTLIWRESLSELANSKVLKTPSCWVLKSKLGPNGELDRVVRWKALCCEGLPEHIYED